MPFNDVSYPELIGHELSISEFEVLLKSSISSLIDEIRSRMNVCTVPDSLSQSFDVVRRNSFGVGENLADSFGNSDLRDREQRSAIALKLV